MMRVIQYVGKISDKIENQLRAKRSLNAKIPSIFKPLANVSPLTLSSAPEKISRPIIIEYTPDSNESISIE